MNTEKAGAILNGLGVTADESLLDIMSLQAEEQLLGLLHTDKVPEQLMFTLAKMTAGEYLKNAYGSGMLKAEGLDLETPFVSSLKMGDTQQNWDASASPASKLNALISSLVSVDDRLIWAYRRTP